jgi:HAD domain in Swiss Army Knife RNA repair proteins
MKVLFLDFDGVLHPTTPGLDPFFVKAPLLDQALVGFQIPIVISSSWRFFQSLDRLKTNLPKGLREKVVGVTGSALTGKNPRHNEILNYLKLNPQYSDWIALDDSYWEFPSNCLQLIQCNPNTGITDRQIVTLNQWLRH